MRLLISILCFFLFTCSTGQNSFVKIYGESKNYKGDSLIFYTYDDYITNKIIELGRIPVDETGHFDLQIELDHTVLSFLYLGKYRGLLFLEPGRNYNLKLPEKTDKDIADKINPYFKPTDIYLGLYNTDSTELNLLVKLFDPYYDQYIQDHFYDILNNAYNSKIDTMINQANKMFSFANNEYFKKYMYYKFALLKFMAYERDIMVVTKKYLKNEPILLNNIAYMDFFNEVYKDYLTYFSTQKDGQKLFSDIALAKSPYRIRQTLDLNVTLQNDSLKDLVILKGLHDAFYTKTIGNYVKYPRKQLFQVLDSMILLLKKPEFVNIAKNIKEKVTGQMLIKGDTAYNFKLNNLKGKSDQLETHKGKFVYLCFFSYYNYNCRANMFLLDNLVEKYKKHLDVIVIFCDGKPDEIESFLKESNLKGNYLLLDNNKNVLNNYKVKIFPSYFLIDPNGIIELTPAPEPNDNFIKAFNKIMRSRN